MTSRPRAVLVAASLLALAVTGLFAQPKVPVGEQPAPAPQPAPPKIPVGPPPQAGEASVKVAPGPEPWYTVFGTGEAIGYIEPCG